MKKGKIVLISFVFIWAMAACNRPDPDKKLENNATPSEYNDDTTDIGQDTLGAGDAKGSDHTEDIPKSE